MTISKLTPARCERSEQVNLESSKSEAIHLLKEVRGNFCIKGLQLVKFIYTEHIRISMWYLKFKIKHSDCIYAPKLEQFKLSVFFYPLGNYKKGKFVFTSAVQKVSGKEASIKKYYNYLKKHKDIVKIEQYKSNFISTLVKHKEVKTTYESIYNSALIYPTPAFLDKEGFEIWEIACWDRKPLEDLIKIMSKSKTTIYFKILSFVKRKLHDVYLLKLLPRLSPKQKQAIELAYKNGYYDYPKKTDLDKLAKLMKVGKSTYQEHLKKAEGKLLPHIIE